MAKVRKSAGKTPAPRGYHHGDLKAALVEHAIELLRSAGSEALTLRGAARAAGVSQAAPYRHFPDRRALVAAAAEEGFLRLQRVMVDRVGQNQGRDGLKGVAIAYVEFAHQNPAQYRIMFGPELAETDDLPSLSKTSGAVLTFVAQGIEGQQAAGLIGPGNAWSMAVATWAMLHGLVMLSLDGMTAGVALNVLVEEATRIMMFGMAGRGV